MNNSFATYITEDCLSSVSGITSRAMFGGHGLYKDGIIFGIVIDDKLYFKHGDLNAADFESYDSKPFTYKGPGGKMYAMSYYEVPEEILENKSIIHEWVQKAVTVSESTKLKPKIKRRT